MIRHRGPSNSVRRQVHRPRLASRLTRPEAVTTSDSEDSEYVEPRRNSSSDIIVSRKPLKVRKKQAGFGTKTKAPHWDPPGPPGGNPDGSKGKKKRKHHRRQDEESEPNYFLIKSDAYKIQDLSTRKNQAWQGICSPTAIQTMKKMKKGSLAFLFDTNMEEQAIVGVLKVSREAYPVHGRQYDSEKTWYSINVTLDEIFNPPITLHELKAHSALYSMPLFRKRVPIQTVPDNCWDYIIAGKNNQATSNPTCGG